MNEEEGGSGWMLDVPKRWEMFDIRVKKLVNMCVCVFVDACLFVLFK